MVSRAALCARVVRGPPRCWAHIGGRAMAARPQLHHAGPQPGAPADGQRNATGPRDSPMPLLGDLPAGLRRCVRLCSAARRPQRLVGGVGGGQLPRVNGPAARAQGHAGGAQLQLPAARCLLARADTALCGALAVVSAQASPAYAADAPRCRGVAPCSETPRVPGGVAVLRGRPLPRAARVRAAWPHGSGGCGPVFDGSLCVAAIGSSSGTRHGDAKQRANCRPLAAAPRPQRRPRARRARRRRRRGMTA